MEDWIGQEGTAVPYAGTGEQDRLRISEECGVRNFEYLAERQSRITQAIVAGVDPVTERQVILNDHDRAVHTYVCGVSGSGKTRFLESLLLQDIAKGHPLCLVDPTGYLYEKTLQAIAVGIERAESKGFSRRDFVGHYCFLDITDPKNPVRINPLEAQEDETAEESIDDFLKAIERLLPETFDAQRRMRRVLRNILLVLAELNHLPENLRPQLPPSWKYPVSLRFADKFLYLNDEVRLQLVAAIPMSEETESALLFWRDFTTWAGVYQNDFRNSSLNTLDYITNDVLVRRFFYTDRSTIRVSEMLRLGKSLFCHFPPSGSLSGARLLGKFLATKLQRCAYRRSRSEREKSYYLYMDEFHQFVDQEFADATTNLRQFGLRLVNAHQSQNQPPFHTAEGKALLQTIRANSQVKAIFRVDREDAESLSKELFVLSQQRLNFRVQKFSWTESEQESWNIAFSLQVTRGTAETWSRASSRTIARTSTMGIGRTFGTNIGETLTQGFGASRAENLARAISSSESRGITEAYSEQHGISLALGENWSQMRDHRRGLTLTVGENGSFAVQRGFGRSISESEQHGETKARGYSSQEVLSNGKSIERGVNGSIALYDQGAQRSTRGESNSLGSTESASRANGEEYSRAISNIQAISRGFEESRGQTETRGQKRDLGFSWGEGEGRTRGGSRQESNSLTSGSSWGSNTVESSSQTTTSGLTTSESWEKGLAHAFSVMEQVSQTYSEALQEAFGFTETFGSSRHLDVSQGESQGFGRMVGRSSTRGEESVYYTLEGERELFVNRLQTLRRQYFLLSVFPLSTQDVKALAVADQHYAFRAENLPRFLLEQQREHLQRIRHPPATESIRLVLPLADQGAKAPVIPSTQDDSWPFED